MVSRLLHYKTISGRHGSRPLKIAFFRMARHHKLPFCSLLPVPCSLLLAIHLHHLHYLHCFLMVQKGGLAANTFSYVNVLACRRFKRV